MSNLTADKIQAANAEITDLFELGTVLHDDVALTVLASLRECAERRDGCEFCKNFDFSGASAKMDSGKYPHIHLAGGSYRYPRDEQFDCCPKCGRKLERSDT